MIDRQARPVRVLESFPAPRPTTNPYIVMLARSLESEAGVAMTTFSWKRALLGRYDVFHAHWPEILVSGHSPLKTAVRQLFTVLLLLRLRLTRTPIVRTVHNLELPRDLSRTQTAILRTFDRWTTLRIRLNDTTPIAAGQAYATILHGHYREWFAPFPRRSAQSGSLAFFGLIRRYKNVDGLLRAFRRADASLRLTIAGKPSSDELADSILAMAQEDTRVSVAFAFLTDAELVEVATSAELVVLPYSEMHNSGGVLSALSLDRPVLVPSTPSNDSLADEVGPEWVLRFEGSLTATAIESAVRSAREGATGRPDLSRRGWEQTGALHERAYRRAVAVAKGRGSAPEAALEHRSAVSEHVTE